MPRRFPPPWTIEDNGVCFIEALQAEASHLLAFWHFSDHFGNDRFQLWARLIRQVVRIRKSTGGYRRRFRLVACKIDLLIKPSLLSRQQRCDVF